MSADEEWRRLAPSIEAVRACQSAGGFGPRLSVDTRHPETAQRALDLGADIINDVEGLSDPRMLELARCSSADWVCMHHTAIPVDPAVLLPETADPAAEVVAWFGRRQDDWLGAGLDLDRIIIDPGIGFGKRAHQSWALLRDLERLRALGHRILVGHSRKSFLATVTDAKAPGRDLETVAVTLGLLDRGVSVFRVHDAVSHQRAYRSWRHLQRRTVLSPD